MTTTSAGNGASAGDGGSGDSGDWGWFAPAKRQTADQATADDREYDRDREQDADGGEIPGRSPSAIRPVGSGAAR
ncbi:MAG: globin domain-containing protein, partial [Streptomyces sp.]